uniref:adenylate cyclase n=1 Tax=Parastrongyloides trichosuri TaxID=131310 RepID=A0A0N4Z5S0_PARTI
MEEHGGKDHEIRGVLLRHWTGLDRARLHTFHLWLIMYSLSLIFLTAYFAYSPLTFQFVILGMTFIISLIISYCLIRCEKEASFMMLNLPAVVVVSRGKLLELETLKDRQEQLLLSVIPAYLADKVSKSMREISSGANVNKSKHHHKLFHDLHVQSHDNVSILFADIVNFTVLAKQLTAKDLVRTLNELYSKFDEDAQKLQCMRIKFLGDCYYCVSGMPVNRPNHADMCVLMGLEMIKTIKQVRDATGVDVNMRIGVHTGNIYCGIIGIIRWQFDVWSDDVTLANHMESSGRPGAVHITKKTKEMLVGDYRIIDSSVDVDNERNNNKCKEETYYILPDKNTILERTASIYRNKRKNLDLMTNEDIGTSQSRLSIKSKFSKITEFWGAETPFANLNKASKDGEHSGRRPNYSNTIQCMTLIENNLNKMNFSNVKSILNWSSKRNEYQTAKMLFPFCKNSLNINLSECATLLILSIPLAIANFCTIFAYYPPDIHPLLVGQLCVCLLGLAMICIIEQMTVVGHSFLTSLAFAVSLLIAIGSHITITFRSVVDDATKIPSLVWLPSAMCHLCSIPVLYRLSYAFRCVLATADLCIFSILLVIFPGYGINYMLKTVNYKILSSQITAITIHLLAVYVLLLFVEWITEYEHKIEAACDIAFKNEETEVQLMQDINTLLIQNILPQSVAIKFLEPDRQTDELYAKDHNNVCVMFASIANFNDYWSECEKSRKLECLRLLNEIVCEFDKLLLKPKFSCIEKIKTVASTYMAASGLYENEGDLNRQKNVIAMVEFALSMNGVLEQLNLDSFQNFNLRIGLSLGPLVGGVIGAQKPQFDIWGNTVNMASRMDSHGIVNKIHITKEVAEILIKEGYEVESCGAIKVKGVKEPMETFSLCLDYLKQCFERYVGRKLVGLSPYHTEFKMADEGHCLEFCYNSASRCRGIVHDRVRHICYFFNDGDEDMTTFAKRMSYFKVATPQCFQYLSEGIRDTKLAGPIYKNWNNIPFTSVYISSTSTTTTTSTTETPSTTTEEIITTNEIVSKENVQAIYKEILKSSAEQVTLTTERPVTESKEIEFVKSFEDISGKLMPKVNGFKAVKRPVNENSILSLEEEEPEIRRKQSSAQSHNKASEMNDEHESSLGKAGLSPMNFNDSDFKYLSPTTEEKNFTGYNDCEIGDIRIWMAIENSEFLPTPDDDRFLIIDAENDVGCKRKCEKSNCDIFTLDEKDKNCRLHYAKDEENGNYFVNQIVPAPNDDFSSRTFKQLCYPPSYVALTQCSDIISFFEYSLNIDPKEVYSGFPSGSDGILNCVELCFFSKSFSCKSSTFDLESGECKLFEEDSISSPKLFKNLPKSRLLYFENGCNVEDLEPHNVRINKISRS